MNYNKQILIDNIISRAFEQGVCNNSNQAKVLRETMQSYSVETLEELLENDYKDKGGAL